MTIGLEYQELDDAIMAEMWNGNRTHAGITKSLQHMADRYTNRGPGEVPRPWGEMISRRFKRLRDADMIRRASGAGWVPVPDHFRRPKKGGIIGGR